MSQLIPTRLLFSLRALIIMVCTHPRAYVRLWSCGSLTVSMCCVLLPFSYPANVRFINLICVILMFEDGGKATFPFSRISNQSSLTQDGASCFLHTFTPLYNMLLGQINHTLFHTQLFGKSSSDTSACVSSPWLVTAKHLRTLPTKVPGLSSGRGGPTGRAAGKSFWWMEPLDPLEWGGRARRSEKKAKCGKHEDAGEEAGIGAQGGSSNWVDLTDLRQTGGCNY